MSSAQLQHSLLQWYRDHKRDLPWRKNRHPYRIWISEVMLQQTTTQAVIPYYEAFLKRFPTLKTLAEAPLSEVLKMWSGLGYYSRARNLHKASQILAAQGFPKTYKELIKLPGFGPYTARSVTSIAFDENVGVLDGNVIRVLSRVYDQKIEWWTSSGRHQLQSQADDLVRDVSAHEMNQALMELGANICAPKNPACLLCPWRAPCRARRTQSVLERPLARPKRAKEIWLWSPRFVVHRQKIGLIKNDYAPFLRGQWLCPGQARQKKAPPKTFHFKHGITHHEIYVHVKTLDIQNVSSAEKKELKWVPLPRLHEFNPTSLMQKVLKSQEL